MTYVRNADLTIAHLKRLAFKCGYDALPPTPTSGCIFAVQTEAGEIIGWRDLPAARRLLRSDLEAIQRDRAAAWKKLGIPHPRSQAEDSAIGEALPDETLPTFEEAMRILHVSRSTLFRLLGSDQLKGRKVGKQWRFYAQELRVCATQRVQSKEARR